MMIMVIAMLVRLTLTMVALPALTIRRMWMSMLLCMQMRIDSPNLPDSISFDNNGNGKAKENSGLWPTTSLP